ncbi:hypothetical protein MUK42_13188 [Musa troglodytarum]|uniref:START domain-containing protein n=1 Tax=Musa troglodytarum TaxID=320322 RepID=A0A9E7GND6_9LILI|nr:hypothetical protein MUK42_13188 [Musa troglodytarum]URE18029.1 hypothetical protein MUK42_13188 [Musa troglodytarum]
MCKMEKKRKILEQRERLDKTLALPDLANEEYIKSLVKNQLLQSSLSHFEGNIEQIIEKRTREVSNFVEMLRSASEDERKAKVHGTSHNDWKVKQDTDQLRVMYREGPYGTPFHTLLAEGYADGPIDVCLCVSWETTLYSNWWPQYNLPTFKIIMSTCLQKVRIGEEISLVRVKVPWPVSDREALLHYFEIEYLNEDLVLVLINTISDPEKIEVSIDDFNKNEVPKAIRIDLVGGFVLQKVDHSRCYFRAITNMDIKLDFVPPSLINFISRQLIGNGHKLYQKAVGTVATTDQDYQKALEGPMYARIREGMNPKHKTKTDVVGLDEDKYEGPLPKEHISETATEVQSIIGNRYVSEIVEEETEHSTLSSTKQQDLITKRVYISPEVEDALGILDNAISILRKKGSPNNQFDCSSVDEGLPTYEAALEASETKSSTRNSSDNTKTSAFGNKLTVLGPETADSSSSHINPTQSAISMTKPPLLESMNKVCDEGSLEANGFHDKSLGRGKSKHSRKKWFCCSIR